MGKTHPPYTPEFRRQIVNLARAGRSVASLCEEFGCSTASIHNWIKQLDLDAGRRTDGVTSDEKAELAQLRKENRVLRKERDILKKAAAWFAHETGATPRGRSGS